MRAHLLSVCLSAAFAALPALAQEAPPFATFTRASEPVLNDPHDLAIGPDGRVYVADKFAGSIAVFDPETLELVEVLADGQLPGVHDISFGPRGEVLVAITGYSAAAVFDSIDALADEGARAYPAPRTEGALAHSNGWYYVMASGVGALFAYDGTDLVATAEGFLGAHDVAEDLAGNIWVADTGRAQLVQLSPQLERLRVLNHPQYGFFGPRYLDVTASGLLVVADQDAHRIQLIDPELTGPGRLVGTLGTGTPGLGANLFDDPEGVVENGGRYYIADSDNNRIVLYTVVLN